jgi:exosortase/archaeosortase family protein
MKAKLSGTQKKLFETLLFLVKVVAFSIPLYAIMYFQGVLAPLQEAVSADVVWMLNMMGIEASRNGFLILAGNGIAFIVSEDCTGWKSMLFLTALICAVPLVPLKKRLAGLAAGISVIYLGNLFRVVLVVLVWRGYGLSFAGAIHDYFWQAGLILLVLVIWLSWLFWTGRLEKTLIKRLHKLIKLKRLRTQEKTKPEKLKRRKMKSR